MIPSERILLDVLEGLNARDGISVEGLDDTRRAAGVDALRWGLAQYDEAAGWSLTDTGRRELERLRSLRDRSASSTSGSLTFTLERSVWDRLLGRRGR